MYEFMPPPLIHTVLDLCNKSNKSKANQNGTKQEKQSKEHTMSFVKFNI